MRDVGEALQVQRAPFILPCVLFGAGIAASSWGDVTLRQSGVALVAFAAIAGLTLIWRDRACLRWALAATMFAAGALCEVAQRPGMPPVPAALANTAPRQTVPVQGCIVEPPVWFDQADTRPGATRRLRFTLELEPGARAQTSIYLRPDDVAPVLYYGQRLELAARFRPIHNYENPGAFDAQAYFAHRAVYWNASATGMASARLLPGHCGIFWRAWIFGLRGNLLGRIETLFGPGTQTAGTLRAMLLGDATRLDESDAESYRRAGVYHVLVVSGLHLAAIGAILLFFLRLVHSSVTAALIWTASIAWLYAALCGGSAPVVRAAGGLTLFALGRWFYRRPSVVNLLAVVALTYLAFDPRQLFDASFQLSFLAVAIIGAIAAPVLDHTFAPVSRALRLLHIASADFGHGPRLAELRVELRLLAETATILTSIPARWSLGFIGLCGRLAAWVGESAILAIAVQFGMALPMVVYFHRFPLTGLSANLSVAPLMTAAVPVGLAAVLTGSQTMAAPVAWAVERSQAIADWHARWEQILGGAQSRVPGPPLWLALLVVASLIACALLIRRAGAWRALACTAFATSLALLLWHPFPAQLQAGRLELTAIDVGQGDSLLAVSPGGSTLLVDTGGIPSFGADRAPTFDIGEEVVSPYLWSRSIRHLDVVAVTHPDADHAGGLSAILENFRPAQLWMGAELPAETIALAQRLGVAIRRPRAGESFDWDGASIDVLAPGEEPTGEKVNNRSLVLRLAYGRHSFLLTGDMERGGEYQMLDAGRLSQVTVLKVAHHGSRTSTTPEFLNAVRPAIALVSVGRDNNYGHPNADVMKRLGEQPRETLRTDRSGMISFYTDGRYLEQELRRE
jgi:competence protein ComEC